MKGNSVAGYEEREIEVDVDAWRDDPEGKRRLTF